jgi:hypothetical protein
MKRAALMWMSDASILVRHRYPSQYVPGYSLEKAFVADDLALLRIVVLLVVSGTGFELRFALVMLLLVLLFLEDWFLGRLDPSLVTEVDADTPCSDGSEGQIAAAVAAT